MRESVVKLLSRDVEAAEDVALELHNKKKIVRENVMKLLIEYKIENIQNLYRKLCKIRRMPFVEKFAPLLETERNSESIEELCGRIVTEQKEIHLCN